MLSATACICSGAVISFVYSIIGFTRYLYGDLSLGSSERVGLDSTTHETYHFGSAKEQVFSLTKEEVMSLNISVELDGHTQQVDPAVAVTLKEVLLELGIESGNFELHYGLEHGGAKHRPGVKYLNHVGGGIQLTIRPGNHSKVLASNLIVRRPNSADDIARRFLQRGRFVAYVDPKMKRRRRRAGTATPHFDTVSHTAIPTATDSHWTPEQETATGKETGMKKRNYSINDVFRFHSREVKSTVTTLAEIFGSRDVHPRIITEALVVTLESQHRLYLKRNTPEEILKGFVNHGHIELDPGGVTARIVSSSRGVDQSTGETNGAQHNQRVLAVGAIATVISAELQNAHEIIDLEKVITAKREERHAIEEEINQCLVQLEEVRGRLKSVEEEIARAEDALESHPGKEIIGLLRKIRADVLAVEL